jgi:pyruvate/2-oxoglutarate dehydrogenase complex dihydrolipoamide dehydrogenase (E3) component
MIPFPDRGTERLVDLSPDHTLQPVGRVCIIGATTVGVGIAMRWRDADIPVTLLDRERASLDKAMATGVCIATMRSQTTSLQRIRATGVWPCWPLRSTFIT